MEKILYVKPAKQAKVIGGTEIRVKDLAQLEGDPQLVEEMLGVVVLRIKGNQEMRLYTSFLDIAKAVRQKNPHVTPVLAGETDTLVMYAPQKKPVKKGVELAKVLVVCLVLLVGSALTLMTFHNEASIPAILCNVHTLLTGEETERPVLLIVSYAAGIFLGISCFFNHFGKKKLTDDPTPVQVQFVQYKKEVDDAVIDELEEQQRS